VHVDDVVVVGEAALRHEALHQAGQRAPRGAVSDLCLASGFQASGKSANIHDSSGAVSGGHPGFIHEHRSWFGVMRAEGGTTCLANPTVNYSMSS
jgi:hypothetical protein